MYWLLNIMCIIVILMLSLSIMVGWDILGEYWSIRKLEVLWLCLKDLVN